MANDDKGRGIMATIKGEIAQEKCALARLLREYPELCGWEMNDLRQALCSTSPYQSTRAHAYGVRYRTLLADPDLLADQSDEPME